MRLLILAAAPLALGAPAAPAQTPPTALPTRGSSSTDNVLLSAEDAFGERIGIELVGLYSESQSRGFSLANTGAYRIDGAYFVPASGLTDPLIGGVSVRLGVNAARLDYPSPSGVVNYRLRNAPPGERLSLSIGDRHFGSFFAELNGSTGSADGRFGIAGGIFAQPRTNRPDGGEGELYYAGVVPVWQPSPNLRLRGLLGYRQSDFDGAYAFTVNSAALAANPKNRTFYGPSWSRSHGSDSVFGGIADYAPNEEWRISGSTFYAIAEPEFTDVTLLTMRPDGMAAATQIRTPDRRFANLSSEARATRRFQTGAASHAIGIGVRNRHSKSRTIGGTPVSLGLIDIDAPHFGAEPAFADNGARTIDRVRQLTGSINYSALLGDSVELRVGLHRSRYEKRVTSPAGTTTERTENEWLYNLSGVYVIDSRTNFFASYVRGLEEAGVAPQNAANRGEILPPVIARQAELGIRRNIASNLNLIGALFDVSKNTPGLRPADNVYTFVGDVRHRGLELSVNGKLGANTSIVAGAVVMRRRLSGQLVDAGRIGDKPAGISPVTAFVSLDQRLPFEGVSIDGRVSYTASRPADSLNTLETPAVVTVDFGGRYNFRLGRTKPALRATIVNLFNEREWVAGTGGTMNQTTPRFLRVSLAIPLAG